MTTVYLFLAWLVGAWMGVGLMAVLAASGHADDHLRSVAPHDFYVARDDLGNEYIVPVPPIDDEIGRERARKREGDLSQEFLP